MKRLSIFFLSLLLSVAAGAQDRAKVVCGPYLQNVTTNSFTILWETDIDALAWVEIAPDSGDHWYNRQRERYYEDNGTGLLPLSRLHKVTISGLEPGTSYRYRIMMKGLKEYKGPGNVTYTRETGSDVFRKKPFKASTLKENYDTLRFCVLNDIHQKDSLLGVLLSKAGKSDFVVFNGDMSNDIMTEDKISNCYMQTAAKVLGGSTPLYVFRGNHDYRGRDAYLWPQHFSSSSGKPYSAFSYGPFYFIGLDSGEDKPDNDIEYSGLYNTLPYLQEEAAWLKEIVGSKEFLESKVRIVFAHIPPDADGWQGGRNMSEIFVPVLNAAGIDLMICGHTHRFSFDEAGAGRPGVGFPVWINANLERLDAVLTVDGSISLESYNTEGSLTHSVSIK